ncbi:MAG: hypothetical protein OXE46_06525 [Chloroflexi bacterium]|nr:hypothetical protein [Chloroflexota bacterium]
MAKQSRGTEGQGLVEYALILVLVAVVVIVILLLLGPSISNIFTEFVDSINGTATVTPAVTATAAPTATATPGA